MEPRENQGNREGQFNREGRERRMNRREEPVSEFKEKLVFVNRVAKVVKGGKNFRFTALMVVGDENGRVACGMGKATEIPEAIRKGVEDAKKKMLHHQPHRHHHPPRGRGPSRRGRGAAAPGVAGHRRHRRRQRPRRAGSGGHP